ncbi:MAG: DUF1832 domain-containing protein [Gammaproteobacteria bacterium]|nr:DUF1832 domain-containing protein [Gammaproteobacteria bacterium]
MSVSLSDIANSTYHTSRKADAICKKMTDKLGWKHRYVAARLAVGRSLSLPEDPPELASEETDDMATPLRGLQLFGEDRQATAWLAMITQHNSDSEITKKVLKDLVARHWHRGAFLLEQDWNEGGQQMEGFIVRLAELAGFSDDGRQIIETHSEEETTTFPGEVKLPVGEIGRDAKSDEPVVFSLNGAGGSPHMAIMGGVGSGKTRTAVHMISTLRQQCELPLLAFDFKGDLTDIFTERFDATLISPPEMAVPLDVLHVASREDTTIKTTAARIRDSIGAVKSRKLSGVQSDALREAVASVLRHSSSSDHSVTLSDIASKLESEYADRGRNPDELTATLNELTQFDLFKPVYSPASFFSKSWLIQLPQDGSAEMRRLIINLTLDALDRWINSQSDAPTDRQGIRSLRHLTMLDEAHVILSSRLPALGNLVRMSRSKGGSIMLISQSPDDFEGAEDGYLDNMGMILAFNTQAKPGPTRRIFTDTGSLTNLQVGEALCRIRSEARTQKVLCWNNVS